MPRSFRDAATARLSEDGCPGALRMHQAADGPLARVRLPGGRVRADQLRALSAASVALGDGVLELTSRANVQVRALRDVSAFARQIAAAGLLPSATHERVRNIVAAPSRGLDGLVADLDRALCSRPSLAELPGRFLFALDDGSNATASMAADIRYVTGSGLLWPGPFVVPADDAIEAMLTVADEFLNERAAQGSKAWRIAELPGFRPRLRNFQPSEATKSCPIGAVSGHDLTVAVPLGRLTGVAADALAGAGESLVITPDRTVIVRDAGPVEAELLAAGLGVDANSPWFGLGACTGRPGCASALADVQADARAAGLSARYAGRRVHFSGCERRCGRPHQVDLDLIATADGYRTVVES